MWQHVSFANNAYKRISYTTKPVKTRMEFNGALAVDFIGPMLKAGRQRYILVAIDLYTRHPMPIVCTETSSLAVSRALDRWSRQFGFPTYIIRDNSRPLTSRHLTEWLTEQKIRRREIPDYS